MQKWQNKKRREAHEIMVEKAKPTIRRYSKSRQKCNSSHSKMNTKVNSPFNKILSMFQLEHYEELLTEFGFPHNIVQRESHLYITEMVNRVQSKDQDNFLSLMNALLALSKQLQLNTKKTPIPRKTKCTFYPPTQQNLKKSASISTAKKSQKTTNFRIKNKANHHFSSYQSPQCHTLSKQKSKISERTVKKNINSKDDSSIVHNFKNLGKGRPSTLQSTNGIVRRINEKLQKIKKQEVEVDELLNAKKQYEAIKQMYLSFDNATMTSNVANIDLQQIIDCFAMEIHSKISYENPSRLRKSISRKKEIKELLKKSLIIEHQKEEIDLNEVDNIEEVQETVSIGSSEVSDNSSNDDFMQHFELASFATDFTCFNYRFEMSQFQYRPLKDDIKRFIQLVMMAGKMEKEAPIMALAYLIRILKKCKKQKINSKNWKNLVFISLVEASKVWDDTSLENHSFSKVIQPYTTIEINRIQRHFLTFLEYNLKIDAKQFCESYFLLRKHHLKAAKTANLMHLDLQTIRRLQAGVNKNAKRLKQYCKMEMNKSF